MRIHGVIFASWRLGGLVRRGNGGKKRDLQDYLQASLVAESLSLAKKQLDVGARGKQGKLPTFRRVQRTVWGDGKYIV